MEVGGTGRAFAYHEDFGSSHSPTKVKQQRIRIIDHDSSITGWLKISEDLRHVT